VPILAQTTSPYNGFRPTRQFGHREAVASNCKVLTQSIWYEAGHSQHLTNDPLSTTNSQKEQNTALKFK